MRQDCDFDLTKLNEIAQELRRDIMRMACKAGGSHIASAFSIVEILTALYFGGVLHYDPQNPFMAGRDRFILSKGHAGSALYATLAKAGFISETLLDSYCQAGTILGGHPRMDDIPGVEATTGALGHGFPFAVGIALAGKMDNRNYRVFSLMGDGECQEGTIWEAALFAGHHRLSQLTAIIDYNKIQAMDRLDTIVMLEPFADKWRAFGWEVSEVDGHDISELIVQLRKEKQAGTPPQLIIAHTIKGKGVSFMEGVPIWHYRLPNPEEMEIVCRELNFKL
jgi:transketolase